MSATCHLFRAERHTELKVAAVIRYCVHELGQLMSNSYNILNADTRNLVYVGCCNSKLPYSATQDSDQRLNGYKKLLLSDYYFLN